MNRKGKKDLQLSRVTLRRLGSQDLGHARGAWVETGIIKGGICTGASCICPESFWCYTKAGCDAETELCGPTNVYECMKSYDGACK